MTIIVINILLSISIFNFGISESALQNYLEETFKDCSRIEYEIVSPSKAELSNFSLDKSREIKLLSEYAYLPVKLNINGTTKNSVITLKVKKFKKIFLAKRDIRKNENLSQEDFIASEQEISELRFDPINSLNSINKFRSKFRIIANAALTENMLEIIPDINLGDKVQAIYSNNSVNISFPVVARSEGIAGDVIRVRNNDNNIFKAQVISNSIVKIIE